MQYRTLGRTYLRVSEIGLGCASFWGKPVFNEREAIALVHDAIAQGVTFFDTGSSYCDGNAEKRLGKALAEAPAKDDLVIATKAGTKRNEQGKLCKDFSPAWIRQSVEQSLIRLGLESVALLQLHGPQKTDLTDELLAELGALRSEGKIRYAGINSFDMDVIAHMTQFDIFDAAMIDYHILRNDRETIVKLLAEKHIGILAGMALAGGLYNPERFISWRLRDIWYALRACKNHPQELKRGMRYRFINHLEGWTGGQVALSWVLRNPDIGCAVIGTTRASHLRDNLQASGKRLEPALLARLEAA